jgi:hypothetical protein
MMKMSNRAERRRAEKAAQKADKMYHLTQGQLDKTINDAIEQAKEEAVKIAIPMVFQMFMTIPSTVLHDKFGFGQVRLDRFMHYCMVWYEALQNGEVTIAELRQMAEEACGVRVILDSIVDKKSS